MLGKMKSKGLGIELYLTVGKYMNEILVLAMPTSLRTLSVVVCDSSSR